MNELNKTIAQNIRRLRAWKNISALELAEAIGVSQSTVSDWETGKKHPRAGAVEKMAQYFGVLKSDILLDKSEMPMPSYAVMDLDVVLAQGARLVYDGHVLTDEQIALITRLVRAVI